MKPEAVSTCLSALLQIVLSEAAALCLAACSLACTIGPSLPCTAAGGSYNGVCHIRGICSRHLL